MEKWKDIVDYEGLYEVSSFGRVRSLDRYDNRNCFRKGHILKQNNNGRGYMSVYLCLNGKIKTYKVHRLVAQAFIPNPDNLPQVNHKDEDKTNNSVENLEWCDNKYNNNYGTKIERQRNTNIKNGLWYTDYSYLHKIDKKEYNRRYYLEHRDEILKRHKNYKK